MAWLILHAPEDAHLVRPLQRFLDLAELPSSCHDRPTSTAATGILVICGETWNEHEWLHQALRDHDDAIAVQITPASIDIAGRPMVDLRTWPARSADRTLVTFVDWLKKGRPGTFGNQPADRPRTSPATWFGENIAAVVLLAVILGGLAALLTLEPDDPAARVETIVRAAAPPGTGTGTQKVAGRTISGHTPAADHKPGSAAFESPATSATTVARPRVITTAGGTPPATVVPAPPCNGDLAFGCAQLTCDPPAPQAQIVAN